MLLEELKVSKAMSKNYIKVALTATLEEAIKCMNDEHQNCVLVVDGEDFLEGILTYGDIRRCLSKKSCDTSKSDSIASDVNACLVSSVCTRGISYRGRERGLLTCYPETDLQLLRK